MFLYILSMSFSSVRYNFKWPRCLFQWSYEPDPHLGWLLLAKWKEHSARACVVWALNRTQISEGSENKRVCFVLCGSHLMSLDGRRSWVRLREAGGNPVPFPPRRHSFWGDFFLPKLSLTPAKMNKGLEDQGPFPPHQRPFTRQQNTSPGGCRDWALPTWRQGEGEALKSARRTATGAPTPIHPKKGCSALPLPLGCASSIKVIYLELAGIAALRELPSQLRGFAVLGWVFVGVFCWFWFFFNHLTC